MRETFEISDRFIEAADANALLYEPLGGGMCYRRTRLYEIDYEGDAAKLRRFVERTLFDSISQELHEGAGPALEGAAFLLDYGMKPSALDLEKEAVLAHYRGASDPGFELKDLTIRQRLYLFGGEGGGGGKPAGSEKPGESGASAKPRKPGGGDPSERFVRDVCNPAIHHWKVTRGDA